MFSLNLMNTKISDEELDLIREREMNRGPHKDLVNMQIRGVRIIFIDEIVKQLECEATARWPQRTREPPEIIDNLLK
ncbi:unnamed protein product [Bursaphelenchus xylophilus]|uniref:(pine wood nematode) hypothetical protein n=1 Tax=Bursaphelenchus xylophilus TaxID=6326 RepID=A0A1I7RT77_BURXY|nr:unnamed protein product [Bursaphelenchus xylophilus]CAG9122556.1 unnamed protein product [Bursaphelenchus xylophilus]